MSHADRHAEIEINYLGSGSITYLYGGQRLVVPSRQLTMFWAAIPHHVIAFDQVEQYYVITIPLRLAIDWRLPTGLLYPLIHGQVLRDRPSYDNVELRQFAQWTNDFDSGVQHLREALMLELNARLLRLFGNLPNDAGDSGRVSGRSDDSSLAEDPALGEGAGEVNECDSPSETMPGSSEAVTESHKKAEAMAGYIAKNFGSRIKISDISSSVGLHPDYASSLFRKALGMTMVDLLTSYRITQAQRLLITSSDSISEIAKASGFDTLSRFNAAFKKMSAVTPREYRRQMGRHLHPSSASALKDGSRGKRNQRVGDL